VTSDVLSGAASGAASAGVTQLIQGVEKLLRRDSVPDDSEYAQGNAGTQMLADHFEGLLRRSPLEIVETIPTFDRESHILLQ
jgi:hypothetical protein